MTAEDNNATVRAIRAIREDQTRKIVEWLRESFPIREHDDMPHDVGMLNLAAGMRRAADAIDAAFGTYEPGSD